MSRRPFVKLTAEQREAANQLSAHMLRVARPFFWHIGVRNDGVPRGASAFILQFERGSVAVTADHVLEEYSAALEADDRTICQLGTCQVWPKRSLIARNKKLDIATFEVVQSQLKDIGAETIDCRGQWPPRDVEEGDTITLTGFLDEQRTRFAANRYNMPAWGAHGIAEAITETDIVTIYEPAHVLTVNTSVPKPPLGLNLSGCSGGPCFLVKTVVSPAAR